MKQIKIFSSNNEIYLQRDVNEFLKLFTKDPLDIISIEFSTCACLDPDLVYIRFSCMVTYMQY